MEMTSNAMSFSIGDPVPTKVDNLMICNIRCSAGVDEVFWSSKDITATPFLTSNYGVETKSFKLGLELSCSEEYLEFFNSLDAWCIEYLTENSLRLFECQRSRDWIVSMYKPCTRKSGTFDPLLRTKILTSGFNTTRYWSADKKSRRIPEAWLTVSMRVRMRIANLYISDTACGIGLECTDIQVCKEFEAPICPF